MRRTQHQHQQPGHPPPPASAAAAPIIDNTQLPKPILLKCDDEGSIGVRISGFPQPTVRWQIGRKRIKESSKYQLKTDSVELIHSLVIARVTTDLDQGVWVIATNQHGEDCCLIEVKTYSMLSGKRQSNTDSMTKQNDLHSGDDAKKVLKKKRRGSSHDTQSIVSLDTYKAEMDHRRRMRSADTSINSIDAQSSYSEMIEGVGAAAASRPRGSKRVSRRDQVPTDLQHKRYSSTEAVHNELRSNSIPPLSLDAQSFASASSIPGTPYEERHMPDLNGNADEAAKDPAKVKKSRRTRSASLTSKSQDDSDNPPRRKKVPRVPKATVSSTAANTNPDDLEKLKPPLPPTAAAKKLTPEVDQMEFAEIKPRKKKVKKRTTSKSSTASADDTLDKSLEELDRPTNQSPNVTTIDQETIEAPKVSNETTEDVSSTSQIDQPLKVAKKSRKRTTSKSSTASANILDKSLEDWNKSPDVTAGQATETQQLIVETVQPVEPKQLSGTEDLLTHVTDEDNKKADISTDDNNNDIWDLFGMKLNVLCQHLLNGKHGIAPTALQIKMKNQTNQQKEIIPEFIDNEAVVLVEQEVVKSPAVTNGVCNDLKLNGLILTDDDSNDKLPGLTPDLSVEIKPPTGKKKKKHPKALQKDSPEKVEDRSSEHRLPINSTHESAVDGIDIRPEIPIRKTEETSFKVHLKNHRPETFVPENNTDSRERSWPVINHDMQLNKGETEGNAPNQKFEYNVDGSDPESPNITKDPQSDLLNFDSDRLKVSPWESREFDDIMRRKATPPLITSSYRISLKPARSEESLAMRPRSETDVGYGRRCELLPAAGRLRVARSVDRLNADDREASVPLIKRRSLSKEWKIVTVTTTEEIVFVQKGKNDTKQADVEPTRDFIQKEENDTKQTVVEPARDLVENGENDTKRVDVESERDHDVEDSDIKISCPNPNEIKYIDSEDSMDMDDDFTWPSPPPIPDNEMPPLTREYAVKQINADVRLVVPISSATTLSNADQEKPPNKPSPPRIESTIRSRIEMLSFFGYDRIPKPSDTKTSETQTISTVEPPTPEVPPPLNLNSFPERTQVHSPDMSTENVNKTVEDFPMTPSTVDTKPTSVLGDDDEVFGDKGENGGGQQTVESKTSYDTRSVSQDMSTQTDQTDGGIEPAKSSDSTSPKVAPKPVIQTRAIVLENTEKATFELVANSCRVLTTKKEEKREGPEPQDTYYVVEHNECVSPVIIHEYGEMLSFCKKQRSLSDAELNIQKTQQQKLEIQLRLQSLWSLGPQRTTEFAVQKSHESLLSDALSAHLANINAAASSRLAETRATYLLETFRSSPTRDQLTSGDAGSTKLGFYSRRPFSDSNL